MTRSTGALFVFCLALIVAAPAVCAADASNVVAERERTVAGGRAVEVIVAQRQIETSIDIGRVASSANGGGLLGMIIISQMDDKRRVLSQSARDRAEATIAPLRNALQRFDVDALALTTTQAALARPAWFQPRSIVLSSSGSLDLTSTGSPQFAVIGYRYETSPDFTQIRVIAEIQMGRTAAANGGAAALDPFYRQQVTSIVLLREPSFEPAENVAKWSADDGKLAKAALSAAFSRLEQLIPLALDFRDSDIKAFTAKNHEKAFAAGYYGPLVARSADRPGETLIWVNGLLNVRPSDTTGAR